MTLKKSCEFLYKYGGLDKSLLEIVDTPLMMHELSYACNHAEKRGQSPDLIIEAREAQLPRILGLKERRKHSSQA
jgi:hypothetical protein